MTIKERIQAELEHLSEEEMAEVLRLLQSRAWVDTARKPGLLSKSRQVQIDAPQDFAAHLEQYADGEKMAALMTQDYLEQRAQRGSLSSFESALLKVQDVDPEPHDNL